MEACCFVIALFVLVRRGQTLAEYEGSGLVHSTFLCVLQDFCSAGSDVINNMYSMNNVIGYE